MLVLGREGAGLHDLVRRTCDHLLRIPMAGGVSSLNVSAAGAVVLYEAFRQRRLAARRAEGSAGPGTVRPRLNQRSRKASVHEVSPARALAFTTIAALLAVSHCIAQSTPATSPAQPETPTNPQSSQPSGQVIFSRSVDADGKTTTKTGVPAPKPSIQMVDAPVVEDADRQAISFTDYDMDVRLQPASQQLVIRALVTVPQHRQDSAASHSPADFLVAQLGTNPGRR